MTQVVDDESILLQMGLKHMLPSSGGVGSVCGYIHGCRIRVIEGGLSVYADDIAQLIRRVKPSFDKETIDKRFRLYHPCAQWSGQRAKKPWPHVHVFAALNYVSQHYNHEDVLALKGGVRCAQDISTQGSIAYSCATCIRTTGAPVPDVHNLNDVKEHLRVNHSQIDEVLVSCCYTCKLIFFDRHDAVAHWRSCGAHASASKMVASNIGQFKLNSCRSHIEG